MKLINKPYLGDMERRKGDDGEVYYKLEMNTREYVPVSLPCIPAHPLVDMKLYKDYSTETHILSSNMEYDPKTGFTIHEPELGRVQKKILS